MNGLESANIKIGRAEERLNDLSAAVDAFSKSRPAILVRQGSRNEHGHFVYLPRIVRRPDVTMGLILGEFAYNLRSALDHLAWGLAAKKERPRPEFPIFIEESKFDRGGAPKIKSLPPLAQRAIRLLQPYNGRDAEWHPLWQLHECRNIDQHRYILSRVLHSRFSATGRRAVQVIMEVTDSNPAYATMTDEGPEKDFPPDLPLLVGFDVGLARFLTLGELRGIHEFVKGTTVPALAGFFV